MEITPFRLGKWLDIEIMSRERGELEKLVANFLQRHSIFVGDRGVLRYNNVLCSLTLNDFPSTLYSVVNEVVSKRSYTFPFTFSTK